MRSMSDNLEKLRRDQLYLHSVITETLEEIGDEGTVTKLVSHVNEYTSNKSSMEETVKG